VSAQPHIIRRQVLNVRCTGDNADGVRLQQETEQLYRTHILPGLVQLLDKYNTGDEVISIDTLSVALQHIRADSINISLAQQILGEVERQLQQCLQKTDKRNTERYTAEERFLQCWLHFLQHGYLPWWAEVKDNASWLAQLADFIEKAPELLLQRLKEYVTDKNVVSRLAALPDERLFWSFFKRLTGWNDDLLQSLRHDEQLIHMTLQGVVSGNQFTHVFRGLLLSVCRQAYTQHLLTDFFACKLAEYLHSVTPRSLYVLKPVPLQTMALKDVLHNGTQRMDEATEPKSPDRGDEEPTLADKDRIYVNNAGVVLVAAYLPAFFARLELIKDNMITDLQRAVGLLHYIISGNEDYTEFEMVLPKILCGITPGAAVSVGYLLTDNEKILADELLEAVVGHWEALKTTSANGLRSAFLQREGILSFNSDTWQLRVQEQSIDVLLDYLPWSISIIRLPWMQHLLQVSWR